MRRTQIQLDTDIYERLRQRAFAEQKSMAEFIRAALRESLRTKPPKKKMYQLSDFTFIGFGTSRKRGEGHIAENHDKELAKVFGK